MGRRVAPQRSKRNRQLSCSGVGIGVGFALRFDGRKQNHDVGELLAPIVTCAYGRRVPARALERVAEA
jgi:hypothetical protein